MATEKNTTGLIAKDFFPLKAKHPQECDIRFHKYLLSLVLKQDF